MRHPYTQRLLRIFVVAALPLLLPACLLAVGGGAGGGNTVCDGSGYCGTESACSGYGDLTSCEDAGCSWGMYCTGSAAPCEELGIDTCDQQQGCGWDAGTGTCGGSQGPCEAYAGTACGYQIGCEDAYGCVD